MATMPSDSDGSGPADATKVEQPTPATVETVDLAPHGDIILVAGSAQEMRVKVAFDLLAAVSPVFKRMLSGRFAEGQVRRSSTQPQEVSLPDDDAQAVLNICRLLYHKSEDASKATSTSAQLYHLVKTADKYDLLAALRLQLKALMHNEFDQHARGKTQFDSAILRAAVTYLLGDAKLFELATHHLITEFNKPLSSALALEGGDVLPVSALLAMSEKRTQAQLAIGSGLLSLGAACDCGVEINQLEYRQALMETLATDTWPPAFAEPTKGTVAEYVARVRRSQAIVVGEGCCSGRSYDGIEGGCVDMLGFADDMDAMCKGLCIRCVREESVGKAGGGCKHRD